MRDVWFLFFTLMRGRKCLNVHRLIGKIFMMYNKRDKNLFNFVSIGHSAPKHVMHKTSGF